MNIPVHPVLMDFNRLQETVGHINQICHSADLFIAEFQISFLKIGCQLFIYPLRGMGMDQTESRGKPVKVQGDPENLLFPVQNACHKLDILHQSRHIKSGKDRVQKIHHDRILLFIADQIGKHIGDMPADIRVFCHFQECLHDFIAAHRSVDTQNGIQQLIQHPQAAGAFLIVKRTQIAVGEFIEGKHFRRSAVFIDVDPEFTVFTEAHECVCQMVFREAADTVVIAVIVCAAADIVQQRTDIVVIDHVVFDSGLMPGNLKAVFAEKQVRESLPVKRDAVIRRTINYRDVFGLVSPFGMACHSHFILVQVIFLPDVPVPFQGSQLVRRICQIAAVEIVLPLGGTGNQFRSLEDDCGFSCIRAQKDSAFTCTAVRREIHMNRHDLHFQDQTVSCDGQDDILPFFSRRHARTSVISDHGNINCPDIITDSLSNKVSQIRKRSVFRLQIHQVIQ